jgi:hypothetical protein
MVIDVIDHEYEETANDIKESLRQKGCTNFVDMFPCHGIVRQMVCRVIQIAPLFSIEKLRIWGHGNIGMQCVAGGACFTESDRAELAVLSDYFASDASVEFHGCLVASGSVGSEFIQSLANLWNVRVRASIVRQKDMIDRTDWVGPVVEARPRTSGLYTVPPTDLK